MSFWVIPGSSPNCARGPPGMKLSTVKPMIETITNSTMLCEKRLSRNPGIRVSMLTCQRLVGRRPAPMGASGGDTSTRPRPSQRVPGFGARVDVRHDAGNALLVTLDRIALVQRKEGQVATNELLYPTVDRAPRVRIEAASAFVEQGIDLWI